MCIRYNWFTSIKDEHMMPSTLVASIKYKKVILIYKIPSWLNILLSSLMVVSTFKSNKTSIEKLLFLFKMQPSQ